MGQEILESLTDDEVKVLTILAAGGSVAPIGRWKKPLASLVRKGLAKMDDAVNSSITPEGQGMVETEGLDETF